MVAHGVLEKPKKKHPLYMPYTHPSIFQESEGSKDFKLLLLDWENVGIGSGPQEIGQYLISHMDPSLRAQVEREIVEDLDFGGIFFGG